MGEEKIIEIIFKNKKIEKICKNFKKAQKEYGKNVAEKLYSLINLLEAIETLKDISFMRTYNFHSLTGKRKGEYALDLGRKLGYRLIIIPLDENGNQWNTNDINIINSTKIIIVMEVSNHYE